MTQARNCMTVKSFKALNSLPRQNSKDTQEVGFPHSSFYFYHIIAYITSQLMHD